MRPEQVKILLCGVGVLISVALYLVYLASARKRGKRTARPRRPSRAARLAADSGWLDFTDPQLRRILAMLKTHLRRHAN